MTYDEAQEKMYEITESIGQLAERQDELDAAFNSVMDEKRELLYLFPTLRFRRP